MVPCPGKKASASPKKAVIPLFSVRASAVSARVSLTPRVTSRIQREENLEGFSRPFLASAPAFLPGQQEDGSERPAGDDSKFVKNWVVLILGIFWGSGYASPWRFYETRLGSLCLSLEIDAGKQLQQLFDRRGFSRPH